jgi:hypothetical protein
MINEQELIKLGFEWDEGEHAYSLLVSKAPKDELVQWETGVLARTSGHTYIRKDWDYEDLPSDYISIGRLDLEDLKALVKILKRAL